MTGHEDALVSAVAALDVDAVNGTAEGYRAALLGLVAELASIEVCAEDAEHELEDRPRRDTCLQAHQAAGSAIRKAGELRRLMVEVRRDITLLQGCCAQLVQLNEAETDESA